VAITAAVAAGSVALLGFGLDSVVEMASGAIILWRLAAESSLSDAASILRVDQRARRAIAVSLGALAGFVAVDAVSALVGQERPESSPVGLGLLILSLGVMRSLATRKRRLAKELHSHAMEADVAQTMICWQLSIVVLFGLACNAAFGWWWADPIAALGTALVIARESRHAWENKACCAT
jgi:divalent metal cation (Fe/Co/Zn/Cd) transporter